MELIFDLGANVGGNIKYYLSKAKKVVAVEANPELCEALKNEFKNEIDSGRLFLVEACLTVSSTNEIVGFYINKFTTGLGRFTEPKINPLDYEKIKVPSISYKTLIETYGLPDFVKIDLEGYDRVILNYMLENELLPNYLQFENQGFETLSKILETNKYQSFNIVSFYNYAKFYEKSTLRFAGPFREEIKSPWLSKNNLISLYKSLNNSWLDVHMSTEKLVKKDEIEPVYYQYREPLLIKLKRLIPSRLKSKIKTFINYRK